MNPFFSDGTISISTSTTKKTSKKKSPRGISWYLAQRRSIGVGWNHPTTRMAYRQGQHRSTRCSQSQLRQKQSRQRLAELLEARDLKKALV
jgi:hypothetical protein